MARIVEYLPNLDTSLHKHEKVVQGQLDTGELFKTQDVMEGIRASSLAPRYTELISDEHDVDDPALRRSVEKALIAGCKLASLVMPEAGVDAPDRMQNLPTTPDKNLVDEVYVTARAHELTGKVVVAAAANIAEEEGDLSLAMPAATVISIALYNSTSPEKTELSHAS